MKLDGSLVATPTYTAGVTGGELSSATYGNGASLATITRNTAGDVTSLAWRQAGGT